MKYVVLRNDKTGKVEKIGRFLENGLAEQFCDGQWESDGSLCSLMFDGLIEDISEAEAEKLIALQHRREKIAA